MPSAWKKLGRNLTGSRVHAFNSCSTEPPWMVLCFPGLPAVKEQLLKLDFDCSSSIAIYALPTCRPQDGEEAARGIISPQVMPTTWSFWKVAECVVYILVASNVQGALIYTKWNFCRMVWYVTMVNGQGLCGSLLSEWPQSMIQRELGVWEWYWNKRWICLLRFYVYDKTISVLHLEEEIKQKNFQVYRFKIWIFKNSP